MKTNKLWLGILIGVLASAIIGLSIFVVYDRVLNKNDETNPEQNNNTDNNIDNSENDSNTNAEENTTNNQNTSTLTDFDMSNFDTTKEAINGTAGWAYQPVTNDNSASTVGLAISLSSDKRSATITIDWSKYSQIYTTSTTTGTREYHVTNFTQNIKEVYIGGFGQANGYETAFYVMEDGTVEYTPIIHALESIHTSSTSVLSSYGSIPNVSGVVRVITATDYCPNDDTCLGGSYNILGIQSDGSFYDLSKILSATNYYN